MSGREPITQWGRVFIKDFFLQGDGKRCFELTYAKRDLWAHVTGQKGQGLALLGNSAAPWIKPHLKLVLCSKRLAHLGGYSLVHPRFKANRGTFLLPRMAPALFPCGSLALIGPHTHFRTNHCWKEGGFSLARPVSCVCLGAVHESKSTGGPAARGSGSGSGCPRHPPVPCRGPCFAQTYPWVGYLPGGLAPGPGGRTSDVQPLTCAVPSLCRVPR